MRRCLLVVLTVLITTSCVNETNDRSLRSLEPTGALASSTSPPSSTARPSPVSSATAAPVVDTVECGDIDAFLQRTRDERTASAGIVGTPSSAPTIPPSSATPPPLGQYLLANSPISVFATPTFVGYLRTAQDLGPLLTGQTPDLAARTGLLWAYARTWTPGTGPGGFQTYVYEFAAPQGAVDFEEGAARGACLNGGELFEVDGLPGAIGQRYPGGYPPFAVRVSFLKGKRRYVVLLTTTTETPPDQISAAARLAATVAR